MPKFHFFSFLQYLYEVLRRCAAAPHLINSEFYLHIYKSEKGKNSARSKLQVYSD